MSEGVKLPSKVLEWVARADPPETSSCSLLGDHSTVGWVTNARLQAAVLLASDEKYLTTFSLVKEIWELPLEGAKLHEIEIDEGKDVQVLIKGQNGDLNLICSTVECQKVKRWQNTVLGRRRDTILLCSAVSEITDEKLLVKFTDDRALVYPLRVLRAHELKSLTIEIIDGSTLRLTDPENTDHLLTCASSTIAALWLEVLQVKTRGDFLEIKQISMLEALENEEYCTRFRSFCEKQLVEENLHFIRSVKEYQSAEFAVRKEVACQIVDEFVRYSGRQVVNMKSETRKKLIATVDGTNPPPLGLFDEALEEVLPPLETEIWPKFLESYGAQSFSDENSSEMVSEGNDFGEAGDIGVKETDELREKVRELRIDSKNPPNLKVLLAKKETREILKDFAGTILARENVMFWEVVQRFKLSDSLEARQRYAVILFQEYIPVGSSRMVNIAGVERTRLLKMYEQEGEYLALERDVFDAALVECIKVMELDLYPKFLNLVKEVEGKGKRTPKSTPRVNEERSVEEIMADSKSLNDFYVFAAGGEWEKEILFWCLVERFRVEPDGDVLKDLGRYLVEVYLKEDGSKSVIVDVVKRRSCLEKYTKCVGKGTVLPNSLFDGVQKEVLKTVSRELYPKYAAARKRSRMSFTVRKAGVGKGMVEKELTNALRKKRGK